MLEVYDREKTAALLKTAQEITAGLKSEMGEIASQISRVLDGREEDADGRRLLVFLVDLAPTNRNSAGVMSFLCATVTRKSLPSRLRDQKSRNCLSRGKLSTFEANICLRGRAGSFRSRFHLDVDLRASERASSGSSFDAGSSLAKARLALSP